MGDELFVVDASMRTGVSVAERALAAADRSVLVDLLERCVAALQSAGRQPLAAAEAARVERSLGLTQAELESLTASATFAFSRAAAAGSNGAAVAERVTAAGGSEALASVFGSVWKSSSPALLAALRSADWGSADRLLGVAWRVSVPLAGSSAVAAQPVAVLELEVGPGGGAAGGGTRVAFQCSHEQLGALFDDVERIQAQLDALS